MQRQIRLACQLKKEKMNKLLFISVMLLSALASCVKPRCEEPTQWIRGKYFADNGCSYPVVQVLDSAHLDLGEQMTIANKGTVSLFRVDNCDFKNKGIKVGEEFYFGVITGMNNCVVCDILPAIFPSKHHSIAVKKL